MKTPLKLIRLCPISTIDSPNWLSFRLENCTRPDFETLFVLASKLEIREGI
jgi:hypothetical protein